MVYVFIRNKIISCDSILPIAYEINRKTGQRFKFVTWHQPTFLGIQKNTVIYDCINEIGKFSFIGSKKNRVLDKLLKLLFLLECALNVTFRKSHIIHFDTLNIGPFRILSSLVSKDRLIMAQTDSSGYSRTVVEVTKRSVDFDDSTKDLAAPKKGALLAFCDNWPWLKDGRVKDLPVYKVFHPRSRAVWKEYVESNYKKYTSDIKHDGKVITIMLGYFGHFGRIRTPESVEACFRETLEVIRECAKINKITVLLKPHIITDLDKLNQIIDEYPELNFYSTFLHPSVIAKVSNVLICNSYSTSVYDGFIQGVPVIEYTDYHEIALDITGGNSSRPEYVTYFINKDREKLKDAISSSLSSSELGKKTFSSEQSSNEQFFERF